MSELASNMNPVHVKFRSIVMVRMKAAALLKGSGAPARAPATLHAFGRHFRLFGLFRGWLSAGEGWLVAAEGE